MSFRKTLSLITIFVLSMFILMLSSSYAWYSFNNASTSFEALTSNEEINVIYKNNKFISTVTAVPISSSDISTLSEKNNFKIDVNNESLEEALSVSVYLTSIEIDNALKNSNFRYDLLYNGQVVSNGDFSSVNSDRMNIVDGIILNNLEDNDFELRIYLLDNGENQNNLMNKEFKAIISVNVVSRVNVTLDNQDIDFLVKDIIIDGNQSNSIPSNGRYIMKATCEKGSNVEWDSLTRTIKLSSGSVVNDRCSLIFSSVDEYDSLSSVVKAGDYVRYVGNNGCVGRACEGVNINYSDETSMGYCANFNNKYIVSGWRVLYVLDEVYLVSAGALECSNVSSVSALNDASLKYCNSNLVYNNVCDVNSVRAISDNDFAKVLSNSFSDCVNVKGNKKCGYGNDLIDNGGYYWYSTSSSTFIWNPVGRSISNDTNSYGGLRPVIRLNGNVVAVSGRGTYEDPYILGIGK